MTLGRYLAIVSHDRDARAAICDRVRSSGFATEMNLSRSTILVGEGLSSVLLGECGAILGPIYTPGRSGALATLRQSEIDTTFSSRGQFLVDRFWGGYVAVLDAPNLPDPIGLRAPFGWLPALHCQSGGVALLASDVELLQATGLCRPRLDPAALARCLLASDIRRRDTALAGVTELRGGQRSAVLAASMPEDLWDPWRHADDARQFGDRMEARHRVRELTDYCVRERTQGSERPLLLLSGGLDSSVVAAALHNAGRRPCALTLTGADAGSDEREPAMRVTQHLSIPLRSAPLLLDAVDITRSASAHLPRPVSRSFSQAVAASTRGAASAFDATMIVDGGAGDNIFCSIRSPAPLADCLLARAGRPHFWPVAATLSELSGASLATLAWRGWARARSRRPYVRQPNVSLLTDTARAYTESALDHPWLRAPPGIPPGKSVQVALLAPAQSVAEDRDPQDHFAADSVLISQPLIETCLKIPTWLWFDRGCNRAAARHAFADALPEATTWRRSKGSPDGFMVALLEHNRAAIRDLLCGGVLADLGLLDVPATLALVEDPRPARGSDFARVLQLADAEVWARSWTI